MVYYPFFKLIDLYLDSHSDFDFDFLNLVWLQLIAAFLCLQYLSELVDLKTQVLALLKSRDPSNCSCSSIASRSSAC